MFNMFFDPSGLTDKEIDAKISEVSERMMKARSCGMSILIIESMQTVLNSCYEEQYSRAELKSLEQSNGITTVFDVEEDYLKKKEKTDESTGKQNYRPGW